MEHRDPYALLADAARRLARRHRENLWLPCLPPLAAAGGLLAAGRLPPEVAAAGGIALAVVGLRSAALQPSPRAAAQRIDLLLDGRDTFLTLATVERGRTRLFELVERRASSRAAGARVESFLPPRAWRSLWRSALATLAAAAVLLAVPPFPVGRLAPIDRLEAVAEELERAGAGADRALAEALREVAAALREGRTERARTRAAEALRELDRRQRNSGSPGRSPASEAGGEAKGGSGARGEARRLLEETAGGASEASRGRGASPRGSGTEENASRPPGGGGLRGPTPEGGRRERTGPSGSQQDTRGSGPQESRGSGEGRSEEGSEPDRSRSANARAAEPRSATQLPGSRPSPDSEPPGQELEGGAGSGWRIVGGRYVRVRIPQDPRAAETERVPGPGEVRIETPYGNAPAPSEGPPGQARERQPLPLEYREILSPQAEPKGR